VMPARGNPRRNRETAEVEYLRRNNALIRRSAIRRILAGRYHTNGIRNLEQLRDELKAATGIESHIMTLSKDLQMMGAIKVRDAERTLVEWWVVPAFNPNTEDLREQMDPEIVEGEVAHKIASHVIDIAPIHQFVYVLTEARAGPLVGYWLSWLTWYGIVYVQEQLDGCIVHCVNDETAMLVAERLTGDKRLRPEAASDEP
jgi:arginine repressor